MTIKKDRLGVISTVQGTSGATVYVYDDHTVEKLGPENTPIAQRLRFQARYCEDLGTDAVPHVIEIYEDGYLMEELYHLPWDLIDPEKMIVKIHSLLRTQVWNQKSVTLEPNWNITHRNYITKRLEEYAPEHKFSLLNLLKKVSQVGQRVAYIHGDPTFDNVMIRANKELVLIDPIPSDHRMPPFEAVDLGKILQSVIGYEVIKHYWDMRLPSVKRACELLDLEGHDRRAALYFCAVHFLRLLPYQPENLRERFRMCIGEVLNYAHNI